MRNIDGKYHVENDQIVNSITGEVIPDDEPLILFQGNEDEHFLRLWVHNARRIFINSPYDLHLLLS